MRLLQPFVYRRYVDFSAIESLRSMKQLIVAEVRRRGLQGQRQARQRRHSRSRVHRPVLPADPRRPRPAAAASRAAAGARLSARSSAACRRRCVRPGQRLLLPARYGTRACRPGKIARPRSCRSMRCRAWRPGPQHGVCGLGGVCEALAAHRAAVEQHFRRADRRAGGAGCGCAGGGSAVGSALRRVGPRGARLRGPGGRAGGARCPVRESRVQSLQAAGRERLDRCMPCCCAPPVRRGIRIWRWRASCPWWQCRGPAQCLPAAADREPAGAGRPRAPVRRQPLDRRAAHQPPGATR
jgi:hypothetical protein